MLKDWVTCFLYFSFISSNICSRFTEGPEQCLQWAPVLLCHCQCYYQAIMTGQSCRIWNDACKPVQADDTSCTTDKHTWQFGALFKLQKLRPCISSPNTTPAPTCRIHGFKTSAPHYLYVYISTAKNIPNVSCWLLTEIVSCRHVTDLTVLAIKLE